MTKNKHNLTNGLDDLTSIVPDSFFKLQIDPRSGLSYDYLNELHAKILIIKTDSINYFDDLQKPLPLHAQYCVSKEDFWDELLDVAKPEAIKQHNALATQFNAEPFEAKNQLLF